MKKIFTYLFFISYFIMMMRTLVPVAADLIAHTFWYAQHMATVHFENGKYHVHYQTLDESKKSFPGKNQNTVKTETSFNDHLTTNQQFDFSFLVMKSKRFVTLSLDLPKPDQLGNYPPPKI